MSKESPKNSTEVEKNKEILGASIGVGGNALRLAIIFEVFVFPFFCFWSMEHSIDIFKTWKTFEYFIFAAFFAPGGAVFLNTQAKLFNKNAKDEWKIYDPKLYALLPFFMATSEKNKLPSVPLSTCFKELVNINLWIQTIKCDIYWLLLMSPFLLLALVCRKTAANVLKKTINEDNKNELREIITKNL